LTSLLGETGEGKLPLPGIKAAWKETPKKGNGDLKGSAKEDHNDTLEKGKNSRETRRLKQGKKESSKGLVQEYECRVNENSVQQV